MQACEAAWATGTGRRNSDVAQVLTFPSRDRYIQGEEPALQLDLGDLDLGISSPFEGIEGKEPSGGECRHVKHGQLANSMGEKPPEALRAGKSLWREGGEGSAVSGSHWGIKWTQTEEGCWVVGPAESNQAIEGRIWKQK